MKRDYLTILEIADDLNVGYRQAYLLVRNEIPHYRVSRKDTRIPRAGYEDWKKRTLRTTKPKRKKA